MSSNPKKNQAHTLEPICFLSASGGILDNPTIEAGDIKVITGNGTKNNISSLPTLLTNSTRAVLFELSQSEMNGDYITIECIDQTSPKEWLDFCISIRTSTNTIDDINISNGIVESNVKEINDNSNAAINLEETMDTVIRGTVLSDGGNTASTFKTDLTGTDDFYGDANGGSLLSFTSGSLAGQQKRITGFVNSTGFITVESPFDGTPSASDPFIIIGRIEV